MQLEVIVEPEQEGQRPNVRIVLDPLLQDPVALVNVDYQRRQRDASDLIDPDKLGV